MAPVGTSPANRFQRAADAWRELPIPVICAITGVAYGAGLQIALGAAMETAAAISPRSPDAIRSIKQLINSEWKMSDEEALALEAELQLGVLGEQNQLEAVAADVKKRAPVFKD